MCNNARCEHGCAPCIEPLRARRPQIRGSGHGDVADVGAADIDAAAEEVAGYLTLI